MSDYGKAQTKELHTKSNLPVCSLLSEAWVFSGVDGTA
jgi:hypothetical protein